MGKWAELKELFEKGHSVEWYLRNFVNLIDDPFDNFKHWLNGEHCIFGWCFRLRIPMRGRGDPTK